MGANQTWQFMALTLQPPAFSWQSNVGGVRCDSARVPNASLLSVGTHTVRVLLVSVANTHAKNLTDKVKYAVY